MGTNYYWSANVCPHCNRADEKIHIGKSSFGWCFGLHITDDIRSLADWKERWAQPSSRIEDEYNRPVTAEEMLNIITELSHPKPNNWSQAELNANYAEKGPNNLLRNRVDGRHCTAHGDGTFDYLPGDFS